MVKTQRDSLILFVFLLIVYSFPLAYDLLHKPFFWYSGLDNASASILPLTILEHGDFTLDEYRQFFNDGWHDPYFVAEVNGHLVSRYPVVPAILALPLYGVPLGTGWLANPGHDWLVFPWSAFFPAKFAAALLTALAGLMFYFCARALADRSTSFALTIAFALGTSVWSTASQGLWQQTPSLVFQLLGIWFLLRGRRKGATAVAPGAFFFSAATVARMNDGFAALIFTLYVFIEYRAAIGQWIAWAAPPALLALLYNTIYNGSPFVFGYQEGLLSTMSLPRIDGLLGLFISPSRGLLVYSPFFILAPIGLWLAWRNRDWRFYMFSAITFGVGVLLLSTFQAWDGGWGYGTRLLVDVLPYATLLLIPVLTEWRGLKRATFWVMVGYAAVLQGFGLWDYGVRWQWHWDNYAFNVWDIADNEPLFYLKQYSVMALHFLNRFVTH